MPSAPTQRWVGYILSRMAKRQLTDRRALITGASSGIGRALAIELARHGVDRDSVARREPIVLSEVAAEIAQIGPPCGLCRREMLRTTKLRASALDAARDELGGLDILINNAGIAAHGRFRRCRSRPACGRSWKSTSSRRSNSSAKRCRCCARASSRSSLTSARSSASACAA